MNHKIYDGIIIGTGQAGPSLAADLAENGWRIAVIEKGSFGGTCVNTGCTPTKAYVASARRAYLAQNSLEHGVKIAGGVEIDLKRIKRRKDKLVQDSVDGIGKWLEGYDNLDIYKGHARFTDRHEVEVNDIRLRADHIFINVGGRPRIPEAFSRIPYLTNATMLELESVPEHLMIVGGGYVGLEFGQMFRRFGSRVTIIERGDALLKKEDDDISGMIHEALTAEGIDIRLNSECIRGKMEGHDVILDLECDEGDRQVKGTHILLAAGRIPNTDDLGLENTGIEMDERGFIKVNDTLETTVPGIFALGDCNGEGAFTHTAYNDYQIVSSQVLGDGSRTLSDRHVCYAAYIDPALGRVGLNEKMAQQRGVQYRLATRKMSRIARAKEMGETQGILKVLLEKESDKILGASFLGVHADEYIHTIIDMMYASAPYTVIRDAVHIHPTISELIPTLLEKPEVVK